MKSTIITFCLIGAVFANPILHNVSLVSSQLDSNSTESLAVSQSSENDTSELQSSEENTSNQSSESESLESTSEDTTSEESDSQSDEDDANDSMPETKDDSMGSEENVRKSWVRVFADAVKDLSTEVKGEPESQSNELMKTQPIILQLPESNPTDGSDSADTSDSSDATPATSESTSEESNESDDTSEDSDSSDASESSEDSNASDSSELQQVKDCVNGTQSCESEEHFFQNIGDDAHFSVDNLMVPDEDERQLSLRR